MPTLVPGRRVRHVGFGMGTVVARRLGRRVLVRFDEARELPRSILGDELEGIPEPGLKDQEMETAVESAPVRVKKRRKTSPKRRPPTIKADVAPIDAARADYLQVLEALRLGVVPKVHVKDYTVSREAELAEIEKLARSGRGMRVIWGDFGTGKTHLIDAADQLAQEHDLVTARIVLDPREVPPTHPLRLYRAISEGLTLPGHAGRGLDPLLERLVDSADHREPRGKRFSRFFSPYLYTRKHGDPEAIAWLRDYVHGEPLDTIDVNWFLNRVGWSGPRVLAMSDFRTYGRMYSHMIGTLAVWARDAGFGGLMLLFDEVEYVDALSTQELRMAMDVLAHFAAVTVPERHLAFDPEDLYKGGHRVHRKLPLQFMKNQPLSVVFALTPLGEIEDHFCTILDDNGNDICLSPLTAHDVPGLLVKISRLYRLAHPTFNPTDDEMMAVVKRLLRALDLDDVNARALVRGMVFSLDALRLRTGCPTA